MVDLATRRAISITSLSFVFADHWVYSCKLPAFQQTDQDTCHPLGDALDSRSVRHESYLLPRIAYLPNVQRGYFVIGLTAFSTTEDMGRLFYFEPIGSTFNLVRPLLGDSITHITSTHRLF